MSFQYFSLYARGADLKVEFEVPTWRQIYLMLLNLAEKIQGDNFKPDVVIAVSRGGWLPARVLSDLLETPTGNVGVDFYLGVGETRKAPVLTQNVTVPVAGKKALVVDDVADSGKSLKLVKTLLFQQAAIDTKVATIYYKPLCIIKPDYYARKTKRWVVFPWETKETIRRIFKKNRDVNKVKVEIAKLAKAGLPKQLAERFLKEISEEKTC